MENFQFIIRKLFYSIPLIIGVTLISFTLMVHFGPDKTYDLLGKNPTKAEIEQVRKELGYDRPFIVRYGDFLKNLLTLDFGYSDSTGEKVISIFKRTIPISILVSLPSLIFGNLLGIILALFAAYNRGNWIDKSIMVFSVIGMSISFLVVIIAFQLIFCSSFGLDLFPVQGWEVNNFIDYVKHVTVPTMASIFVALGYNTRFYRAVIVEEMTRDHVRTAKAFGIHPVKLLFKKHIEKQFNSHCY